MEITQNRIDLANQERFDKDNSMSYTKYQLDDTARIEREFKQFCEIEQCNFLTGIKNINS